MNPADEVLLREEEDHDVTDAANSPKYTVAAVPAVPALAAP